MQISLQGVKKVVYLCSNKANDLYQNKMTTFRKIELEMSSLGRGQYQIIAQYKGRNIKVHSTDSETYDWLNDDSDKAKHADAKRCAYGAIRREFDRLF